MRQSPEIVISPNLLKDPLKDERLDEWSPQRLSDRKLEELQQKLERLHSLGDTFVDVRLSDAAHARLKQPQS